VLGGVAVLLLEVQRVRRRGHDQIDARVPERGEQVEAVPKEGAAQRGCVQEYGFSSSHFFFPENRASTSCSGAFQGFFGIGGGTRGTVFRPAWFFRLPWRVDGPGKQVLPPADLIEPARGNDVKLSTPGSGLFPLPCQTSSRPHEQTSRQSLPSAAPPDPYDRNR